MIDGGIYDIESESDSFPGCETCDYGSSYINEFWVKMTNGRLYVKVSQMYSHVLSDDFMMKLMLRNVSLFATMKEIQFTQWLKEQITNEIGFEPDEFDYSGE